MTIAIKEGWIYHAPDGTGLPWDTDPTMTALYKFGYLPANNSSIINKSDKILAERIRQVGQYSTSIHTGNKPNGDISMNFGMINGLPIYWMLGKATEAAGVFTISNLDGTTRKKRLGLRQEIDGKNFHNYGVTVNRLSLSYVNSMLWADMSAMGMKDELSVAASVTPTWPSDVGNAYNVLTAMTWDGVDLKPVTFRTEMSQSLSPFMGEDGYYTEISEFSPIEVMHAMQFLGSEAEAAGMVEDFVAKSEKTFTWTVSKAQDATKYITCTGTGVLIDQDILKGYGLETFYTYAIWCSSLTFTVVDGLNKTTFYGIAA